MMWYYVLVVGDVMAFFPGDIRPLVHGPCDSKAERNAIALRLYHGNDYLPDNDTLFALDINEDGQAFVYPFTEKDLGGARRE